MKRRLTEMVSRLSVFDLFLENTALTGTQQQFLRKQVEQLKRAQQITEEMVIAEEKERKIYQVK